MRLFSGFLYVNLTISADGGGRTQHVDEQLQRPFLLHCDEGDLHDLLDRAAHDMVSERIYKAKQRGFEEVKDSYEWRCEVQPSLIDVKEVPE